MDNRMRPTYWDRAELLETVKEFHQKLHGERPEAGLYDDLEIKWIFKNFLSFTYFN